MWSSSPSESNKPGWKHDVFLSFRGEDTRRSFVSHLYAALSNKEIKTFIDERLDKGTKLGAELVRAIQGSQISLVILSLNYASSRWCLDELVEIIECRKTYGQEVMPIFYEVDPSCVRNQTGEFGNRFQAFLQTDHNWFGYDVWRYALKEVANITGWDSRIFRTDAELVETIVDHVLKTLIMDMDLLPITDFPVGLEVRAQEMIDFIEGQSGKGRVLGIWGMGGSGKTTIAKFIYNRIRDKFKQRSFIEASTRGHIDLQEKLLYDVLKTKVNVHSIDMGISMIEKRLRGEKTLILLDDVTEFAQLKALFGNCKWIGVGSVVIFTTRDIHLLKLLKVDFVYKMEEMDENESLKLFSLHAFGEAETREDLNELARKVVAYCRGLPLALEVLGSYLRDRTKKVWESVLLRLEKIPDDQVQKKLRISFDGLSNSLEKDIFLDICCFFIGKNRANVTEILNGCGLCADIGITVLIERSLINVEKNNKLGMHPLLRDMGRDIICESSRTTEPGKLSRLWFEEDVLDVLKRNTGTEAIQGLSLKLPFTSRDCFEADAFGEMKGLRLLQLDHVQLSGNYEYLSKKLRWVCWQGFHLKFIPNNFDLKGVIAIDLKYSNLRLLWKKPQVLQWLKILNFSHSKCLRETPAFSGLPSLEKLILKDCPSLLKVHQSIGDLQNLLLINLKDCTSLSTLPREIYKLKSLKTLILSGCLKIDILEEDLVQMESLMTLIAENTAVKQVPFSIVRSKSIGYISLCGYVGPSHKVIPSIIWSWMSPRMNCLSHIHSFHGTSSSLVPMDMQNNDLGDLAQLFSNLSNQRSVLMQCDTESLFEQLGKILDITKSEITSYTSQFLKHSLESYLISIGSCAQQLNTLSKSISEGLATSESSDEFLPGDNRPYWSAHAGDALSVNFTVPENCCMKGITLCVVYLSTPENTATECLNSIIIVNYTKCNFQIFKRDTLISFNDVDWQSIISNLGPRDKVEIFVTYSHGLVVKKIAVYLMYGESINMEIEPLPEPKKNAFIRFLKKTVMCDFCDMGRRQQSMGYGIKL